ncbi:MAG: hypothetical protein NUV67_04295 [archaeon]|nr:hypothetical protein [archaeon]
MKFVSIVVKKEFFVLIGVVALLVLAGCIETKEPSPKEFEKLGFIGCSITHNAVDGYTSLGGGKFWGVEAQSPRSFGGGSLILWHKQLNRGVLQGEKDYWRIFETLVRENPEIEALWWEQCSAPGMEGMSYEDNLKLLAKIKEIAPNVEIYASPMPVFSTTEGLCVPQGVPAGWQASDDFVSRMVAEGKVKQGPILTHLPNELTTGDGCHANDQGKRVWGQELIEFFGK